MEKVNDKDETYIDQIRGAGRSDLLGWLADELSQPFQEAYNDFRKGCDWGSPGNIEEITNQAVKKIVSGCHLIAGKERSMHALRSSGTCRQDRLK